jgi:helix-turn-helix protein
VLVSRGIGPVHAQVFKVAAGESDAEVLRQSRKWDTQVWNTVQDQMRERGWLTRGDELTTAGTAEYAEIERLTDAAAMAPWRALGARATERLAELLAPLTRAVLRSVVMPAGNPVGLTSSGNRTGPLSTTTRNHMPTSREPITDLPARVNRSRSLSKPCPG